MFISEVKYIVINQSIKKSMRIKQFLKKLLPKQAINKIKMFSDNEIGLTLIKNLQCQN